MISIYQTGASVPMPFTLSSNSSQLLATLLPAFAELHVVRIGLHANLPPGTPHAAGDLEPKDLDAFQRTLGSTSSFGEG